METCEIKNELAALKVAIADLLKDFEKRSHLNVDSISMTRPNVECVNICIKVSA